jgi:two-component system chemotaxis response regulator CheY
MKQIPINELSVLIVDDNRHMRMLIRHVVFTLGVKEVEEAVDSSSALEALQVFAADLVLCDLQMEPMGGLEFVEKLRSDSENPFRLVPVIMITAYAEMETVANARDIGVTEFMSKPITAIALNKRIERVFKDPRHFVVAQGFVGPDRRRSQKDELAGAIRRENPATFIN